MLLYLGALIVKQACPLELCLLVHKQACVVMMYGVAPGGCWFSNCIICSCWWMKRCVQPPLFSRRFTCPVLCNLWCTICTLTEPPSCSQLQLSFEIFVFIFFFVLFLQTSVICVCLCVIITYYHQNCIFNTIILTPNPISSSLFINDLFK